MLAGNKSKFEIFRYLLEMGADINNLDNGKENVLHLAVQ